MDHLNGEEFVERIYDQVVDQVKKDYRERSYSPVKKESEVRHSAETRAFLNTLLTQ